ncbi:MAG: hypothetical protein Ta2B_07540 [Termitinemataceae bacterium]|nr:MAG: hypothetical protein Ta2B_07540 [Termitinemataceae bacterium]
MIKNKLMSIVLNMFFGKKTRFLLIAFIVAVFSTFAGISLFAQNKKITIKLASIAPENTPWGEALNNLRRQWSTISGGQVELIIYHNGLAGGESDAIRKLKLNQIQAAVLTSLGLNEISPEVMTLSTPFLIRSDAEMDTVLTELKSDVEGRIIGKGFYPIAWNKAGYVRFFARNPVRVPADLKKQKFAGPESEPTLTNTFKSMGYQVIPLSITDEIIALNSGSVDVIFQSPISAAPMQLFGIAKNMSDFKIAPFLGAIVMNNAGWNSLPAKHKEKLLNAAAALGPQIDPKIAQLESFAIKTMKDNGLNVVSASDSDLNQWYADMDKAIPALLANKTFNQDLYNKISAILKRIRK